MLSLGICVGAGSLHLGMLLAHRTTPSFGQFTLAFLVVTAVSALASFWNMQFSPAAGEELSGRAPEPRSAQGAEGAPAVASG